LLDLSEQDAPGGLERHAAVLADDCSQSVKPRSFCDGEP
jgi:hypothetical protein